ncbi:MAG: 4'-phosphopantetheinyl transferase superfamily protein [Clostridia bacterium]|nr:4'-phosphopantetheinyl transferase superfamily protein [Clostridia bacterium]
MIRLYYAVPGSLSIRELYERADSNTRKIFDDSAKAAHDYYSLFCRVLSDIGIAEYGADPEQLEIYKNEFGKEYIKDRDIYYNVSHTYGLLCSAVSDSEIGVDCETVCEKEWDALAERFFTQREYEAIKAADDPLDEFFRVWTKKESYVKYTGEGLSRPLGSFDVKDIEDIQTTYKIANTYLTITGDISHIRFTKEGN